ncbi:hypothetical protein O3M35_011234 [Rhynocoris fuscipes]|uniref:Craniofacial development protein 1 n=1 Tax=Rhynocoris fuscipes TaxID=488301 RepID=A0AAW1CZZ9_9HEMI
MGDSDLQSDSDSCDEDYVPGGAENEALSEEESGGDASDDQEGSDAESQVRTDKKRKKTEKRRKRSRKKLKSVEKEEVSEEKKEEKVELSAEDRKQKADALWADFLKDCDPPVKKKTDIANATQETVAETKEKPADIKIVQEFEFAGEKVLVEKKVASTNGSLNSNGGQSSTPLAASRGRGRGRGGITVGGGIASILGQIGKKNKLSTLEKSKLDWDSFKKSEGIEEELEQHNKGKNGYLERQDFLERADVRQFEIEKSLRAAKRSSLR